MPDSFEEHFDRATRALAEGWAEQALVPATEAVKLAPDRADVRVVLARAWLGNGGWARAIADAKAALDLDPPSSVAAVAQEVIGRASLRLDARGDAETALREARRLAPAPAACALLTSMVATATDGPRDAASLAREDSARPGETWEPFSVPFEALAVELERVERSEVAVRLAAADLCFDAGLFEDAKAHYQQALALDAGSERAADGLRAIAAGVRTRPRAARVRAAPSSREVRLLRLVLSGLGGSLAIFTLARWPNLAHLGPIRSGMVVIGFAIVAVCITLARRDELATRRAAEIAKAGGSPS